MFIKPKAYSKGPKFAVYAHNDVEVVPGRAGWVVYRFDNLNLICMYRYVQYLAKGGKSDNRNVKWMALAHASNTIYSVINESSLLSSQGWLHWNDTTH